MKGNEGSWERLAIEASRTEAARLIQLVAGARRKAENVKARIARTAKILDWKPSRVRHIWQREAARIHAHEMDELRRRAAISSANPDSD